MDKFGTAPKVLLLGPAGTFLWSIPGRILQGIKSVNQKGIQIQNTKSKRFGGYIFLLMWYLNSRRRRKKQKSLASSNALLSVVSNEDLETLILEFAKMLTGSQNASMPSWIKLNKSEGLDWLNSIIWQLWPYADSAFFSPLGSVIQPLLDDALKDTKFLTKLVLDSLTLGRDPPRLYDLTVSQESRQAFEIEVSVRWDSSPDIKLLVYSRLMNAGLIPATATLSNLSIAGDLLLRVVKKEESNDIAGMSITLTEPLNVDYSVHVSVAKGFKGVRPQSIPGLYPFLRNLLSNITKKYMTFPSSLPVFINSKRPKEIEQIKKSLQIPPQYRLKVTICSARNLKRFQEYYVMYDVRLQHELTSGKRKLYSKTSKQKGNNPTWEESAEFSIHNITRQRLAVTIYGKDWTSRWVAFAKANIPLLGTKSSQESWYSLYKTTSGRSANAAHSAQSRGDLKVRLSIQREDHDTNCSDCLAEDLTKISERSETASLSKILTFDGEQREIRIKNPKGKSFQKYLKGIPRNAMSWLDEPEACTTRNINRCLELMWPIIEHHFSEHASLVNCNLLKGILPLVSPRLESCTLGKFPPSILSIRHHDAEMSEALFDVDVMCAGDQEIVLSGSLLGNPLGRTTISVRQIQIVVKLRVSLSTLMPVSPAIGTVSVSCIEKPYVDFDIGVKLSPCMPTLQLASLPGFGFIFNIISAALIKRFLMHPAKIEIPLVNFRNPKYKPFSKQRVMTDGYIHLKILRCDNVMNKDSCCGISLGSDPYAVIVPGSMNKTYNERSMRTRVMHQTLTPEWNESFSFMCDALNDQYILVGVFDYDAGQGIRHYLYAEKACESPLNEAKEVNNQLLQIQHIVGGPLYVDWSSTIINLQQKMKAFMRKLHGLPPLVEDDGNDSQQNARRDKTDLEQMVYNETGICGNDFLGCILLTDLGEHVNTKHGTTRKTLPLIGGEGGTIDVEITYQQLKLGLSTSLLDSYGTLVVELRRLQGIHNRPLKRYKSYVVLEVSNGTRHVSKVQRGRDPAWYETFVFQNLAAAGIRDNLYVQVFRFNRFRSDTKVGQCSIALAELLQRGTVHGKWRLGAGTIDLSIAWFSTD